MNNDLMTINGFEPSRRVSSLLKGLFRRQRSISFFSTFKLSFYLWLLKQIAFFGCFIKQLTSTMKSKKTIFFFNKNSKNKIFRYNLSKKITVIQKNASIAVYCNYVTLFQKSAKFFSSRLCSVYPRYFLKGPRLGQNSRCACVPGFSF